MAGIRKDASRTAVGGRRKISRSHPERDGAEPWSGRKKKTVRPERKVERRFLMVNAKQMGHPCKKHLTFVKCVERRAFGMSPEIILRSITWREFVFHVISVIRPFLLGRT